MMLTTFSRRGGLDTVTERLSRIVAVSVLKSRSTPRSAKVEFSQPLSTTPSSCGYGLGGHGTWPVILQRRRSHLRGS